jgi:proton glutamate symport protein
MKLKFPNLVTQIFIGMLLGAVIGHFWPDAGKSLKVLSDIFLRLIKTIISPLIFATLVVGIAGHSNLKQIGRMGLKAIIYFEIATTLALFIGLAAINLTHAGVGASLSPSQDEVTTATQIISQKKDHNVILDIFPENIAKAIAEGQILQVVVFSILFAIGLSLVTKPEQRQTMLSFCESLAEVMFKFTDIVMRMAPLAVAGAMAYSISILGLSVLKDLLALVLTLYGALAAFVLLVFVPIAFMIKLPFKRFIQTISEPVTIAFATASSEAALPKTIENLEYVMKVPNKIVSFVIPTGYSFNLDGSTLYLSLASVFIAQASGLDLTMGQQIYMCFVLMLTSKGVAGVRGASFLILVSTISSFGISPEKAFVILGVDVLMDMARTAVNLIGNCLATVVVAKWEGEFDQPVSSDH